MATARSGPRPTVSGSNGNASEEASCIPVGRPWGDTYQILPENELFHSRAESQSILTTDGAAEDAQPRWTVCCISSVHVLPLKNRLAPSEFDHHGEQQGGNFFCFFIRAAWPCVRAGEESVQSGEGNSWPGLQTAGATNSTEPGPQRPDWTGQRPGQDQSWADSIHRQTAAAGDQGRLQLLMHTTTSINNYQWSLSWSTNPV